MENKTFDILRTICGTIAVLITFIGAFINVKRKQYNDEIGL